MTSVKTNDGEAPTSVAMNVFEEAVREQQEHDNPAFTDHLENGQNPNHSDVQLVSKVSLSHCLLCHNFPLILSRKHGLLEIKVSIPVTYNSLELLKIS